MFDVNTIPMSERVHITKNLLRWGINVDQVTGKIDYIEGTTIPEVKCEPIHLIRHAETVAVAKHEFMNDTSDNCGFTEDGIAITHQQAKELDAYDFDVALYGPISRVVHTKELIMQTDVPLIVARGRKGGSNIAACICNALLYMMDDRRS